MFNEFNNINNMLYFVLNPQNPVDKAQANHLKWSSIWYGVLSNILTGIFDYENIPRTVVKRMEKSFFSSGYVCAYEDAEMGIVIAPCIPKGNINAWGEYSAYEVMLPDGSSKSINLNECVIGYNYHMPTIADSVLCYQYAEEIAELKISIDNAIILSRHTAVMEVPSENALNEALTKFNNHTLGVPVMVARKRKEEEHKTLNFTSPTTIDDYYNGLRDILNEFLTTTGLSSLVNPNKKERLIVDEVSSNDDIKNTLLTNRIQNREDFIEAINDKFGTDWKVSVSNNIYDTVNSLVDDVNDEDGGIDLWWLITRYTQWDLLI